MAAARIAVLGAGAFGPALCVHLATRAHAEPHVTLYARSPTDAAALSTTRGNARHLPGVPLPASVSVTSDPAALRSAEYLLLAVPSTSIDALCDALLDAGVDAPMVW